MIKASGITTIFNLDEVLLGGDPAEEHMVARDSIDLAVELGASAINVPHPLVNAALVETAQGARIGVWAFTIDDESRFVDLMDMGVVSLYNQLARSNGPSRKRTVIEIEARTGL